MEESQLKIGADQVHEVIRRYMVAEGLDVVVDFEKSRGSYLYDAKRDQYFVDFFSFFATNPIGFNHPRMTSSGVVEELSRTAIHKPSNSDVYSREMAEFVDTFARLAKPDFMKHLFFIEGGALGVENALKAAFDWKVRRNLAAGIGEKGHQVIHFREAFHGRSGYTLSLTNTADQRKVQYFPKFKWPRIVNPKCRFPLEGENLDHVLQLEEQAVGEIEAALASNPDDIACLIVEPVQGEGGDNHFRTEFHRELRRLCDEHDILLIHDEVQTGLGATGRMWAFEHYVQPDIVAFGKKTQVCGMMVGERIDQVGQNVFHVSNRLNSTWGGNLLDMVRCRLYLEIYAEEKLLEHSRRVGEILLRELRVLEEDFPETISNTRGLGLFCAFDLPNADARQRFRQKLFESGLIILGSGEYSIRFRPALNITEEELMKGIAIIREVVRQFE